MKKILILFIVPFLFIGCNKDDDSSSSSSPYAGYWEGTYSGSGESGDWNANVDSDGNMVGVAGPYDGEGTVSDDGDFVFGTVSSGAVFTGEAQGNDYVEGLWVNGSLNGTWSGSKQ